MKMFTKRSAVVTAIILLLSFLLAGCAGSGDTSAKASPSAAQNPGSSEDRQHVDIGMHTSPSSDNTEPEGTTFYFSYNNIKITPNDLMKPLLTALGEPLHFEESPSCAYTGMDKIYVYSGFSVYTYQNGDTDSNGQPVDYVLEILITDDSVTTPEGLMLGASADQITQIYGNDYTNKNGSYSYRKNHTELLIIVTNERVQSIQYWHQAD